MPTGLSLWLGGPAFLLGLGASEVTLASLTDACVEKGMGTGQAVAQMANLRALMLIVAPLVYGRLYILHPVAPFLGMAASGVAAEVVNRTLVVPNSRPSAGQQQGNRQKHAERQGL